MKRHGFSLIELLVVVTIIVLLMALLAPALDKAMYQAMLVQCAGQENVIARAGTLYAFDNKRHYPAQPYRRDGWQANELGYDTFDLYPDTKNDLRPLYEPLIGLKPFLDPLCEKVDLSKNGNAPNTQVSSAYDLWMGFQYFSDDFGGPGMYKIGDRLGWRDNTAGWPPPERRGSFLVSDVNGVHINNVAESAHPDDAGLLMPEIVRSAPLEFGVPGVGLFNVTWSWWSRWVGDGLPRGAIDINIAFDDGSVRRYNGVTGSFWSIHSAEGTTFSAVPWHAGTAGQADPTPVAKRWLPAQ